MDERCKDPELPAISSYGTRIPHIEELNVTTRQKTKKRIDIHNKTILEQEGSTSC